MEQVEPGIWKIRFGEPGQITPAKFKRKNSLDDSLDKLLQVLRPPLGIDDFAFRTTARGCVIEYPLQNDECIYGFGLQLKSLRQNGKKKTLRVNSDQVADTGDSHAPVPFCVSTHGYGYLWIPPVILHFIAEPMPGVPQMQMA